MPFHRLQMDSSMPNAYRISVKRWCLIYSIFAHPWVWNPLIKFSVLAIAGKKWTWPGTVRYSGKKIWKSMLTSTFRLCWSSKRNLSDLTSAVCNGLRRVCLLPRPRAPILLRSLSFFEIDQNWKGPTRTAAITFRLHVSPQFLVQMNCILNQVGLKTTNSHSQKIIIHELVVRPYVLPTHDQVFSARLPVASN